MFYPPYYASLGLFPKMNNNNNIKKCIIQCLSILYISIDYRVAASVESAREIRRESTVLSRTELVAHFSR